MAVLFSETVYLDEQMQRVKLVCLDNPIGDPSYDDHPSRSSLDKVSQSEPGSMPKASRVSKDAALFLSKSVYGREYVKWVERKTLALQKALKAASIRYAPQLFHCY